MFESVFVKIQLNQHKYSIVGNIYRPNTAPLASVSKFEDILQGITSTIKTKYSGAYDIQICGDLNLDFFRADHDPHILSVLSNLLAEGHLPLVTKPTLIMATSYTLLDQITSFA